MDVFGASEDRVFQAALVTLAGVQKNLRPLYDNWTGAIILV